jgi:HK97 family phage prohead protease
VNHFLGIDMRSVERSEAKAYRVQHGGFFNALFDETDDVALDGQACRFNEPFPYKGDLIMLRSGCFGDITDRKVACLLDHEESMQVADTNDALELMIDDDGLQFRLDLAKCQIGPLIARMCKVDNRSAISVGSDILAEHKERIGGESVRVVTRARLKEITICKEGCAGDNAFAMVVSKSYTPKPVAGRRSATFEAGQRLHKLSRKVKALKASIAAMYGTSEQPKPTPRRPMTMDQFIRLHSQTDETEKLQALARSRLCC